MGIILFASLPPTETRGAATASCVGSEALPITKSVDSVLEVLEGQCLFNVDTFYSPLCHGALA